MLCNSISYYPNKVDEMIFFQDNDIEKVEIMNHYNELISQGKYSEASEYISQQENENVYGFFADFFNLIENRIYTTQEYLQSKPPKKQPFIYYEEEEHYPINDLHIFAYVDEEDIPINCFHIFTNTDEDEDLSLIRLFEDESNEDGEFVSNIHVFADCYAEIEEDFSSIVLFSDDDEQESLENLYIFTGEEGQPPNADIDTIWI